MNKYCVLVVDDGSDIPVTTGALPQQITDRQQVKVIRLSQNKGITEALNAGLKYITEKGDAEYIARLDCGDICDPQRFYRQVDVLRNNTDIMLLGSWCEFKAIDSGKGYIYKTEKEHAAILRQMHWRCSFIHPTVMFRREVLHGIGFYPNEFPYAEDYAFFFKICLTYNTKILDEVLLTTEINPKGISASKRKSQRLSIIRILKKFHKYKHLLFIGLIRQYLLYFLPEGVLLSLKRAAKRTEK